MAKMYSLKMNIHILTMVLHTLMDLKVTRFQLKMLLILQHLQHYYRDHCAFQDIL